MCIRTHSGYTWDPLTRRRITDKPIATESWCVQQWLCVGNDTLVGAGDTSRYAICNLTLVVEGLLGAAL